MTARIFIDSNIWIYLFTKDNPRCKIAAKFISANSEKNILIISYQVINEVSSVLKKKGFAEAAIRFIIEQLSNFCLVQDYSREIALAASLLREKYSLSFWDSLIVASASAAQCSAVISEDLQDGQIMDGITVKNIFAGKKKLK